MKPFYFLSFFIIASFLPNYYTKDLSGTIVIEKLGLVIEPEGFLVGSYEDRYIHLVFDYDHTNINLNSSCERNHMTSFHGEERLKSLEGLLSHIFHEQSMSNHQMMCNGSLSECIYDSKQTHKRQRRFLGTLLVGLTSIFGIGTSISNTISLKEQQKAISYLQDKEDKVIQSISILRTTTQSTIQALDNLFVLSKNEFQRYEKYLRYIECEVYDEHQSNLYREMLRVMESRLHEIVNAILSGDISPGLIPLELLRSILSSPDLKDVNFLAQNPSLIYKLGKIYPISLNPTKKRIHFLLQIPIVKAKDVTRLFHILNFGFMLSKEKQMYGMLKTLNQVNIIEHEGRIWPIPVNQDACSYHNDLYFCRFHPVHKILKNDPLQVILNSLQIKNRSLDLKSWSDHVYTIPKSLLTTFPLAESTGENNITHTRSGIAIVGCTHYSIIKSVRTHLSTSIELPCDHHLTFVPYSDFESLIVFGVIVKSPLITNLVEKLSFEIEELDFEFQQDSVDTRGWEKLSSVINSTLSKTKQVEALSTTLFHIGNPWVNIALICAFSFIILILIASGWLIRKRIAQHNDRIKDTQKLSLVMSSLLKKQYQGSDLPSQVEFR